MSIYLWCILVIVPNPFDLGASSGAVFAWTTDILPKFLIKYGKFWKEIKQVAFFIFYKFPVHSNRSKATSILWQSIGLLPVIGSR